MTDIKEIIAHSQDSLRSFAATIVQRDIPMMLRFREISIELEDEAATPDKARAFRRQVDLIDTIGRFIYGKDYDDALEASGQ